MLGDAVAEQVAVRWPWLPVVLLSGNPDALSASRVEAVGALAVLAKPVGAEELTQVLAQALRARRGRRLGAPVR
jgi:CheY-like chemotaxis protein